jgi:hypothetical protein
VVVAHRLRNTAPGCAVSDKLRENRRGDWEHADSYNLRDGRQTALRFNALAGAKLSGYATQHREPAVDRVNCHRYSHLERRSIAGCRSLPPMLIQAILALSPLAAAGLVAAFIVGGTAKGALGIGLPLVAVPLTVQFLDLPVVIGLLSVPMLATNIGGLDMLRRAAF